MAIMLDTTIVAQMQEASRIAEALGALASIDLGELAGVQIHLGVMESLTNIIRHGYGHDHDHDCGAAACGCIAIRGECDADGWSIAIMDDGHPIPPDCLAGADGSVFDFDPDCLAEVPTGGMGLTLMMTVFDRVDYAVRPEGNRLLLERRRVATEDALSRSGGDEA
jgi:anti-sigma regulatory factor (Ser/Thr protein kinase)